MANFNNISFWRFATLAIFQLVISISKSQIISNPFQSVIPETPGVSPETSSIATGLQFRHREILNASSNTILEWEVEPERHPNSTIVFNFTTNISNLVPETVVFLGISITDSVANADVIAIYPGAPAPYLVDMHGIGNSTVTRDTIQNWNLIDISTSSSAVSFSASRTLSTCDSQDAVVTNDLRRIIWGVGTTNTTDTIPFIPEGIFRAYLTDPTIQGTASSLAPFSFRISRQMPIPPRHTSYWCTLHKGPQLPQKHHISGYAAYFTDSTSQRHVHHQIVHRCIAPPGTDPAIVFDRFVGHPGEECYLEDQHQLPLQFCNEMVHSWGLGGREAPFPHDIGLALGTTTNEYFMFETHYDNPNISTDIVMDHGVDIYYSDQLRPTEGGLMYIGAGLFGVFQVPPQDSAFTVIGQCSPKCTEQMIATSGGQLELRSGVLHAHQTVRKITLRHFRGNMELPAILSDGNYDYTFQHRRQLAEPRNILAGDLLVTECEMDTSLRNRTTMSGFATRDEMCAVFLLVNRRTPNPYCSSEYPTERFMERYGIRNMTWSKEEQERFVRDADNTELLDMAVADAVDQTVGQWTEENRREVEREQMYGEHDSMCQPIRYLLPIGQWVRWAGQATGQVIPGEQFVESISPSTRTISGVNTPPPSFYKVRFPAGEAKYDYEETQKLCEELV